MSADPALAFEPAEVGAENATAAITRRCWRCLQQFPLDPDEPIGRPAEWWVCEACHASLLGKDRS